MFSDFADVSRGPGRKDDRNGGRGRRGGNEQRVVDGGIGWLEAVTDTAARVGDEEVGGLARVDLRGGGGGQFFPFLSEGKSGSPSSRSNGVQARIRRAHASRARGFSSHPTPPFVSHPRARVPRISLPPFRPFSLFILLSVILFCSHEYAPSLPHLHLQVDRPTLDPLVHEHTLAQVTRRLNALVEVSYRISSARRARS